MKATHSVALLTLLLLTACGETGVGIGAGQHRLVGVTYQDPSYHQTLQIAFTGPQVLEVRRETDVMECAWEDQTAAAQARGENTMLTIVDLGRDPRVEVTDEPAGFSIQANCPRPMGQAQLRFHMVIAQDLSSATRRELVEDIGLDLFMSSSGDFDIGRVMRRVDATSTRVNEQIVPTEADGSSNTDQVQASNQTRSQRAATLVADTAWSETDINEYIRLVSTTEGRDVLLPATTQRDECGRQVAALDSYWQRLQAYPEMGDIMTEDRFARMRAQAVEVGACSGVVAQIDRLITARSALAETTTAR